VTVFGLGGILYTSWRAIIQAAFDVSAPRHLFFHPDYTVGPGLSPDPPPAASGTGRVAGSDVVPELDTNHPYRRSGIAAPRAAHPAPKIV